MSLVPKIKIVGKDNELNTTNDTDLIDLYKGQLIDLNFNKYGQTCSQLYKINLSTIFNQNENNFKRCLYDQNRPIDQDRIQNMKKSFENQEVNFFNGLCTIGYINWQQPKILDGQHRLCLANQLSKCPGYLNLISFDNQSQMWDYYLKINKSTPVPDYYKSSKIIIKEYISIVCQNIANKYPKIFSPSRNCRKPHLNIDNFKECLYKLYTDSDNQILKINLDLSDNQQCATQIYNDLENFNDSLKNKTSDYFGKSFGNPQTMQKAYQKVNNKGGLYLGLFFSGTNDSLFCVKYIQFMTNKYSRTFQTQKH